MCKLTLKLVENITWFSKYTDYFYLHSLLKSLLFLRLSIWYLYWLLKSIWNPISNVVTWILRSEQASNTVHLYILYMYLNNTSTIFLFLLFSKAFRAKNREVQIKTPLRCTFLPLNQTMVSTTFSTCRMTLIQSALDSPDLEQHFRYPEHYHHMHEKFSTWLWSQNLRKKQSLWKKILTPFHASFW